MKLFLIIAAIVFSIMGGKLLVADFIMIDKALHVQIGLKEFCEKKHRYPSLEEFKVLFPGLTKENEWYYWLAKDMRRATFQYPMTFPLPSAPGKTKLSEFIPIIYASAVVNPCQF
jgi:hypothetical protein